MSAPKDMAGTLTEAGRYFAHRLRVRRYGRRDTFGGVQRLERDWLLFGRRVWTTVLDEEEVPAWAEIQAGALGSTEWTSKFREHM